MTCNNCKRTADPTVDRPVHNPKFEKGKESCTKAIIADPTVTVNRLNHSKSAFCLL